MGVAGQEMYHDGDLNLEATELRLGLPEQTLSSSTITTTSTSTSTEDEIHGIKRTRTTSEKENTLSSKTQIVGWPPVPSFRKNHNTAVYVKVDMDGIPYLRKIDLKGYLSYGEIVTALERMFKVVMWDDYIPTYEDKDGDWMLAGDVPWEMFVETCKRLRIVTSSDAKGMMGYL